MGEPESIEEQGEVQFSEIEQQAIEHGWNPDGVEGKRNLSAEEFMDRQSLYDDIKSLKRSNRKLQEGIEAMKELQSGIRKRERDKVIAELKQQKAVALRDEDYDAVVEIDDRIASERANSSNSDDDHKNNPAWEEWIEENDWYHQNDEMREYADMIGIGYSGKYKSKPLDEVYKYVTKQVKKQFPEQFRTEARNEPDFVEGASVGRRGATSKSKFSERDLPDQDRRIMETIVRSGAMTKAQYLKEYFG